MSVTLTNRPPKDVSEHAMFRCKTHIECSTITRYSADAETGAAILQTVGKIEGLLKAFGSIATEGNLTITLTSETTQMEGELTCYYTGDSKRRDEHLRKLDVIVTSFQREFAPCIRAITFSYEQTCSFEYAPYRRFVYQSRGTRRPVTVLYVLLPGNRCVFTGTTAFATSTVNAAEEIILGIAGQEGLVALDYSWFDLQTNLMYHTHQPGEFEFKHIVIEDGKVTTDVSDDVEIITPPDAISVARWMPVPCPTDVLGIFKDQIGPDPYQMKHPGDHRPGSSR